MLRLQASLMPESQQPACAVSPANQPCVLKYLSSSCYGARHAAARAWLGKQSELGNRDQYPSHAWMLTCSWGLMLSGAL